jgi:hypothetical protein
MLMPLEKFTLAHQERVLKDNPQEITKKRVFYVGQTSRSAHERYEQHLTGIKAGRRWVMNYGIRLVSLDDYNFDLGRGISESLKKELYRLSRRSKVDPRIREAESSPASSKSGFLCYLTLIKGTKTALKHLIDYNRHDVLGMRHLVRYTQS